MPIVARIDWGIDTCKQMKLAQNIQFPVRSWNVYGFKESHIPEQVHIALGEQPSTISITWVTQENTESSTVLYGTKLLNMKSTGYVKEFIDGGREQRKMYVHRVILSDLIAGTIYYYKCGSLDGWSDVLNFRALPSHPYWSPKLAVYGDMGATDAPSLPELIHQVKDLNSYDMVLHVGDFAYNMDTNTNNNLCNMSHYSQTYWDYIPNKLTTSYHKIENNICTRFGQVWLFNVGPAHIVAFSSELYYFLFYGWKTLVMQYDWLYKDLLEANKPENRKNHPWIIVIGHRPMYCSNNFDPMHCDFENNIVRTGFDISPNHHKRVYLMGLENLFYQYGVDLIIAGHEHSYERFWPVYNRTVCNSTTSENPYENPDAPVHIVSGAAGSDEGKDTFIYGGKPWSAFRTTDFGYTRMTIRNVTHLEIEQISVENERKGQVIDSFTIIKDKHGPGLYTCHNKDSFDYYDILDV
ncbi:acid phosphatase-related [Schistosoma mansoni]|uniref:acid phosphatase-related n=1 Tax=Schistosoma mansoni TaxID=6183 RepID=UPI00022C8366|nr:acid phosphatase-related [Schistosoma mansoni]|eukprot:XP_018644223.1 acid phosphatase-related [Schistosoma mansoni]